MRIFVIAIALLTLSATANAVTLDDAFQLTTDIKTETNRRCPESKSGDLTSLTAALKCRSIEMGTLSFGVKLGQFANQLMDECLKDIRAGKNIENCRAANQNYKNVVLTGEDERMYMKLRIMYDALLREWPVLRH